MKFEYKIHHIDLTHSGPAMTGLNKMGKEGWDVISTVLIRETTVFILLKRSIPEDEPANPDWTLEGNFIGPGLNG